jgi:hypothetical protein
MLPPKSNGIAAAQCGVWLSWAAAQIDAGLAADAGACNQVLASLADLMDAVRDCSDGAPPGAEQAIERDMSAVIVAMQAHDRVTQGLAHVAQSLRTFREYAQDPRFPATAESWRVLCEKQMRSFSMAEERTLFARMVATGHGEEAAIDPAGNSEVFSTADPLDEPW